MKHGLINLVGMNHFITTHGFPFSFQLSGVFGHNREVLLWGHRGFLQTLSYPVHHPHRCGLGRTLGQGLEQAEQADHERGAECADLGTEHLAPHSFQGSHAGHGCIDTEDAVRALHAACGDLLTPPVHGQDYALSSPGLATTEGGSKLHVLASNLEEPRWLSDDS